MNATISAQLRTLRLLLLFTVQKTLSPLKDGALIILTSSTSISGTAALAVVLGNFVA
ncbi:hypothetical protein [Rhizobium sp. AN5]|uniref:hypothetical protein n=1 Tax=Rhizobium sp. AN5 TaxID=1855304 RepID=UPI002B233EEC|nr:hypothetical protein [Rhizobium sp. AN5]